MLLWTQPAMSSIPGVTWPSAVQSESSRLGLVALAGLGVASQNLRTKGNTRIARKLPEMTRLNASIDRSIRA